MYRYKILTQNNTELTRRKKNVQNRWMRGMESRERVISSLAIHLPLNPEQRLQLVALCILVLT